MNSLIKTGLMIILYLPSWLAAGVYKWVDEQGNIHFGDSPVAPSAEQIELKPSPPADQPKQTQDRKLQRQKLLDAYQQERAKKREADLKKQQDRKERRQNCASAKDQLRRYRQAGYLYGLDKEGNRVILSDQQRMQETEKIHKAVATWCK